jgi:hypothetical protein
VDGEAGRVGKDVAQTSADELAELRRISPFALVV